jgi:hypothetical protein
MAKKRQEIVVSTAKPQRKKTVPKSAFKKDNTLGFKKGESGRTRKKADTPPDDIRLVSRALRVSLGHRAPNERALAVGLPMGASWAQIIAQALLLKASEGDVQAAREVAERSEGGRAFGIGIQIGDAGEPGSESTPLLNVVFVSSDLRQLAEDSGLYRPAPEQEPPTLEGKITTQSELDPDLARAREEAQRAALRIAEPEDEEEEPEAASDDEDAAVTKTEPEPESTLPPLPPGFEYWPKWKMRQYRMNRWKIPPNVVEM